MCRYLKTVSLIHLEPPKLKKKQLYHFTRSTRTQIYTKYGPRYDWDAYDQGLLLGAFYFSYPVAGLLIGIALDRYGIGRWVNLAAFSVSALAVLFSPLAAASGKIWWLFGVRLIIGIAQGGIGPNIQRLISKWAPPAELGIFCVAVLGTNVGSIVAWTLFILCGRCCCVRICDIVVVERVRSTSGTSADFAL